MRAHSDLMLNTTSNASDLKLVAQLAREHARLVTLEENAKTLKQAWRYAALADTTMRRLRAARAGEPMPVAAKAARQSFRNALLTLARMLLARLGRKLARRAARKGRRALRRAARRLARTTVLS